MNGSARNQKKHGLRYHAGRVWRVLYDNIEPLVILNLIWFVSASPGVTALLIWHQLPPWFRYAGLALTMLALPAVAFTIYWAVGQMLGPYGVAWASLRRERWRLLRSGYRAMAPGFLGGYIVLVLVLVSWKPATVGANVLAVFSRLSLILYVVLASLWWPMTAETHSIPRLARRACGHFLRRPFGVTAAACAGYFLFFLASISMGAAVLIGFSLLALVQSYYLAYLENAGSRGRVMEAE